MENTSKGYLVGDIFKPEGTYARTFKQRTKGLSGISISQSPNELVFENCRSIHTFGMRFNLCVIFLDRNMRILKVKLMSKNRVVVGPKNTYAIVELPVR